MDAELLWLCEKCSSENGRDIYRCSRCNAIKPYTISSIQTLPAEEVGAYGGDTDAGTGGATGFSSSSLTDTRPWQGGARPRHGKSKTATRDDEVPLVTFVGSDSDSFSDLHSPSYYDDTHQKSNQGYRSHHSQGRQLGKGTRRQPQERGGASLDALDADESQLQFPDEECRMVVIGRTGNGKSSTGNTILGQDRFRVGPGLGSETEHCQMYKTTRFGIPVEVVDTPGFFDTSTAEDTLLKEIRNCIGMVLPGPHALLLVIGGRFTEEQADSVEYVRTLFGEEVMRHVVVVFTMLDDFPGGDDRERALRDILKKSPDRLRKLIMEEASGRYVVFNNKGSERQKRDQVRQLLMTISGMLAYNGGKPYTTKLLDECDNLLQNYEKRLMGMLNRSDLMTRKEVRRVFQALFEKDDNTKDVLEQLLQTQTEYDEMVKERDATIELMGSVIRQHKVKTDEVLSQRKKCCIL